MKTLSTSLLLIPTLLTHATASCKKSGALSSIDLLPIKRVHYSISAEKCLHIDGKAPALTTWDATDKTLANFRESAIILKENRYPRLTFRFPHFFTKYKKPLINFQLQKPNQTTVSASHTNQRRPLYDLLFLDFKTQ